MRQRLRATSGDMVGSSSGAADIVGRGSSILWMDRRR